MKHPTDLARERRIRARLDDLRRSLRAHPDGDERLVQLLHGTLACPDLEDPAMVGNEKQTAIRMPEDLLVRIDALVEKMGDAPEFTAYSPTRSAVMRIALTRGVKSLEEEYGKKKR
ncbi:MAG: hypothetical protein JXR83_09465 [Deltaproteobacteria bacterium]|nr:hypothetical protein [Deltaproteobacteria bacterium]